MTESMRIPLPGPLMVKKKQKEEICLLCFAFEVATVNIYHLYPQKMGHHVLELCLFVGF
jgi:hypothetical protein